MSEINPFVTILYEGEMTLVAEYSTGYKIPVEPVVAMGGSGKVPNPIDYLVAALGGCTSIKMLTDMSAKGLKVDFFSMKIDGIKSKVPPGIFEKLHLIITLSGKLEDSIVSEVIKDTLTFTCPVAVMFRKSMEITWEYKILD